ncbi:hypothetical protein [Rhodococcus sp. NPDC057529]|uniref:hypothetical protein n=1 Tax=Rhodococcus sp. NPDC057529 TaxID=3346158 RepID=UPI003671A517
MSRPDEYDLGAVGTIDQPPEATGASGETPRTLPERYGRTPIDYPAHVVALSPSRKNEHLLNKSFGRPVDGLNAVDHPTDSAVRTSVTYARPACIASKG